MKVAVCTSGMLMSFGYRNPKSNSFILPENYLQRNYLLRKEKFPDADFYYATWSQNADAFFENFPNEKCFIFEEPEVHYHPFSEEVIVSPEVKFYYDKSIRSIYYSGRKKRTLEDVSYRYEWLRHACKQILIHAMLLDKIKTSYDVIVRTRYDVVIHDAKNVNFQPFIEDCFLENRTHGFSQGYNGTYHELISNSEIREPKLKYRLNDHLIIHPRYMIDYDKIMHLYNTKQLRGGEFGWHQLLSEPYSNNHKNWRGWVANHL